MRMDNRSIDSVGGKKASRKFIVRKFLLTVLGCALLMSAACSTGSPVNASADRADTLQANAEKPVPGARIHREDAVRQREWIISPGTMLSVRLLYSVSSGNARTGDTFEAALLSPLEVNGKTLFPRNTRVQGRVVAVRKSGRLKTPGFLQLALDSIQSSNGQWISIATDTISATGESHARRNATLIGGGAGVGAILGAIIGKGKGAAIGAGVGAAGGTAGAYSTGAKEASFGTASRLTFNTTRESVVKG